MRNNEERKNLNNIIGRSIIVSLVIFLVFLIFMVSNMIIKKDISEAAKEYFYLGRYTFLEEMYAEDLHNKGILSNEEYLIYKDSLIEYSESPEDNELRKRYEQAAEPIREMMEEQKVKAI